MTVFNYVYFGVGREGRHLLRWPIGRVGEWSWAAHTQVLIPSIQVMQIFLNCPRFARGSGSSEKPGNGARFSFRTKPPGMGAPSPVVVGSPEQQCSAGHFSQWIASLLSAILLDRIGLPVLPSSCFRRVETPIFELGILQTSSVDKKQNIFPMITDNRQARTSPSCSSLLPLQWNPGEPWTIRLKKNQGTIGSFPHPFRTHSKRNILVLVGESPHSSAYTELPKPMAFSLYHFL